MAGRDDGTGRRWLTGNLRPSRHCQSCKAQLTAVSPPRATCNPINVPDAMRGDDTTDRRWMPIGFGDSASFGWTGVTDRGGRRGWAGVAGVQTVCLTGLAEGVDAAVVHGGSGAGSARIEARIERRRIGKLPEDHARVRIQTPDDVLIIHIADGEQASAADADGGESTPDLRRPKLLGSVRWPGSRPRGFLADAVAVRTAKLRPIVRRCVPRPADQQDED